MMAAGALGKSPAIGMTSSAFGIVSGSEDRICVTTPQTCVPAGHCSAAGIDVMFCIGSYCFWVKTC